MTYCFQSNLKADPSYTCPLCGLTIEDVTPVKVTLLKPTIQAKHKQ